MNSNKLDVYWAQPGSPTQPTALAFTGFGHRLDPWDRLRTKGWRIGVVDFPVGSPASQLWDPKELAQQVSDLWQHADNRALLSFSFGGAGSTLVSDALNEQNDLLAPEVGINVAPVQWARAPWKLLRTIPRRNRMKILRGTATGAGRFLSGRMMPNGVSGKQFLELIDRYNGWDLVEHYAPYLEWIDSPKKAVNRWNSYQWPVHLIGAHDDRVIPSLTMKPLVEFLPNVHYHEVAGAHFTAVDRARPYMNAQLGKLLT